MPATIPVQCEEIAYKTGRYRNQLTFVLPSLSAEFTAEFVPSKTATAIKRVSELVNMEIDGAEKATIVAKIEQFLKGAAAKSEKHLTPEELEEFKLVNGWIVEDQPAPVGSPEDVYRRAVETLQAAVEVEPVADIPAAVESGINEGMTDTRADIDNAPVVTSDGRYIVDPVALTVEPVADIPADIAAIMPVWDINPDMIEFWPRSFDIAPGMEAAFEVEQEAAAALLIELGGIIWGACSTDIALDALGNTARLIDSGRIIGPAGSYPAVAKPVAG